ncbi:MAG: DnaJ domain-containing protein [Parvularculaceae bacterium]
MSDYAYKPRFGYDIRVKPPSRNEAPVWAAPSTRLCEAKDCRRRAAVRAAKSPRAPREFVWLCAEHAREHNRRWNYFDGLSDSEAEAVRQSQIYGERPTWGWARNERAGAAARARGPADFIDAFGLFGDAARKQAETRGEHRNGRRLTKLQVRAFRTLALPASAPAIEIRRRYAELLRRFHPDANGGDRGAEEQLSEVVRAHQILKKAGIC